MARNPTSEIRIPASFDVVYRDEYPNVLALTYALTGSGPVARHLVGQVFVAAYREWDRIGRLGSPDQWIRQRAVSVATSRSSLTMASLALRLRPPRPPDHSISLSPATEVFWQKTRTLPRSQAKAIALQFAGAADQSDIAACLGITEGTAGELLHEALLTLQDRTGTPGRAQSATEDTAARAGEEITSAIRSNHVPTFEEATSSYRRRRVAAAAASAVAIVAVSAALVVVTSAVGPETDSADATLSAADESLLMPTVLGVRHDVAEYDFKIWFPSSWNTATSPTTSPTADQVEIFAGGTGSLAVGASGCVGVPAAIGSVTGRAITLIIRERIGYTAGDFPSVGDFVEDPFDIDAVGDTTCLASEVKAGTTTFERAGRGFVAIWGFGPEASAAEERVVWDVLTEFAPELPLGTNVLASRGRCNVDDLPEGWQESFFRSGPLLLWLPAAPTGSADAVTIIETVAVVEGREQITIRVPDQASELVSLVWDPQLQLAAAPTVGDGFDAISLLPCDDGPSQHAGKFIVAPGVGCVPLEIRIGNDVSLRAFVPVTGGSC